MIRYDDLLDGQPLEFDWPDLDERSAAAMCYTSGTTGNPKGVVYSHRSSYLHSMSVCAANGIGLVDGDRVLPIVPMFHANAWGQPYAAVMAGADLLLPDRFLQAAPLVDMIEQRRPTVAAAVPTIWNDVLQYLHANPGRDISSLRTVCCGGSAVPLGMMKEYEQSFGVTIRQGWGMTETSPLAALATPPPEVTGEDHWALRSTAGRVFCGVEVRLVDDAGCVLPNDGKAVGEIEIRGPWITGSYYQNADPSKFDDGWLRTGDVGRIDPQGFITLTDRAKDVIKSGGEWISSVELELLIMDHPAVLEAAVVAVPDDRWQERPLAAVVVKTMPLSPPPNYESICATRSPDSGCRSAGRSSTKCRRRVSASSTRKSSGLDTPTVPSMSSSAGTEAPRQVNLRWLLLLLPQLGLRLRERAREAKGDQHIGGRNEQTPPVHPLQRGIGLRREVADQKYRPDNAEDERHRLNDDVPLER